MRDAAAFTCELDARAAFSHMNVAVGIQIADINYTNPTSVNSSRTDVTHSTESLCLQTLLVFFW